MKTVGDLLKALQCLNPNTPIRVLVTHDVLDEIGHVEMLAGRATIMPARRTTPKMRILSPIDE